MQTPRRCSETKHYQFNLASLGGYSSKSLLREGEMKGCRATGHSQGRKKKNNLLIFLKIKPGCIFCPNVSISMENLFFLMANEAGQVNYRDTNMDISSRSC